MSLQLARDLLGLTPDEAATLFHGGKHSRHAGTLMVKDPVNGDKLRSRNRYAVQSRPVHLQKRESENSMIPTKNELDVSAHSVDQLAFDIATRLTAEQITDLVGHLQWVLLGRQTATFMAKSTTTASSKSSKGAAVTDDNDPSF